MSDDFLKKIASNSSANTDNPLNKLFENKKNELGIKEEKKQEEKTENKIDGIENLGKTTTKNDFSFEYKPQEDSGEEIPAKSMENQDIFSKEENISADDLPAKSLENADIFKDNSEADNEDDLLIPGNSSTKELSFDDEQGEKNSKEENVSKDNPFDELTINFVVDLLKHNKPDEAIKLITDKKNGK